MKPIYLRKNWKQKPRRSNIVLFKDIFLSIYKEGGRASITAILYGSNTAHTRLKKYLKKAVRCGYLRGINRIYILTPRGLDFIKKYWEFKMKFEDLLKIEEVEE